MCCEVSDRLRVHKPHDRLVAGHAGADEDRSDDREPGVALGTRAPEREGDAQWDRGGRVTGVVDQVGEERDTAGENEDEHLGGGGQPRIASASPTARRPSRERLIEPWTSPWL